jgi:hypothetical protein
VAAATAAAATIATKVVASPIHAATKIVAAPPGIRNSIGDPTAPRSFSAEAKRKRKGSSVMMTVELTRTS